MKSGFDISMNNIDSLSHVLDIIAEYGFVRVRNFVSSDKLGDLFSLFKIGLEYENYPYGYGKMARFSSLPSSLTGIKEFYSHPFFQECIRSYWNPITDLRQEYSLIHDYKFDPNTIYGRLHFDRRHQLKFMIYLTEVTSEKDGAFCVLPKSNSFGKSLYTEFWKKTLSLDSNDVTEIARNARLIDDNDQRYRSLPFRIEEDNISLCGLSTQEIIPITGSPGTLVIFDTHVLHLGGKVESGRERKTIRLHTFPI